MSHALAYFLNELAKIKTPLKTTSDSRLRNARFLVIKQRLISPAREFIVINNDVEVEHLEDNNTVLERRLIIPITDGTEEIEIIGTSSIPEFQEIILLVLATSILFTILLGTKYGRLIDLKRKT